MAAKASTSAKTHTTRARKKRPGIHSKKKSSNSKKATNYKKRYRGQGK
jgi:hypothetical protein